MTIRELHKTAASCLRDHGFIEARREAGVLISALLHLPPAYLYSHPEHAVSPESAAAIMQSVRQRAQHVPLAYLTGETEFFGLVFAVFPGVLIPRPDSEILVETALDWAAQSFTQSAVSALKTKAAALQPLLRILDLCTGTGCVGISLARTLRDRGYSVFLQMTDIDQEAIRCAEVNVQNHQLADCSILSEADLFPERFEQPFHILVSNPPYIAAAQIDTLMPEVLEHEPHLALNGGPDGLDFYRRIISRAPEYLVDNGLMLFEHGWDQADALAGLIKGNGLFNYLPVVLDYGHNPRVSGGTRKNRA